MSEHSSPLSKIWIIATLTILVVGGIFAWQYFGASKEVKSPEKVLQAETANTSTSSVQGWQTYRNEEIKFEVMFPRNWKASVTREITPYALLESPDYSGETIVPPLGQVVHSGTRVIINRYENPGNFTPDELVADYATQQNRRIVEVGGVQGVTVDTRVEFGIYETVVVLVSENFVYQINRTYPEGRKSQYGAVFDQILSTFRFIESK